MQNITWNGEKIITDTDTFLWNWYAILDGYDPTPWDSETPARGPHSRVGWGDSPMQAACDLIEQLWEARP
jgi:hypothetical protein